MLFLDLSGSELMQRRHRCRRLRELSLMSLMLLLLLLLLLLSLLLLLEGQKLGQGHHRSGIDWSWSSRSSRHGLSLRLCKRLKI